MKRLLADEAGATAIEYGVIVALVGIGLSSTLGSAGAGVGDILTTIAAALDPGVPPMRPVTPPMKSMAVPGR